MIFLAAVKDSRVTPFREIARLTNTPEDFLAKILKTLADKGLVKSTRGAHGGFALAKAPADISFLQVIEAVEGPVSVNICLDPEGSCHLTPTCTMHEVWKLGQEKMLDVYRETNLAQLVGKRQPEKRFAS